MNVLVALLVEHVQISFARGYWDGPFFVVEATHTPSLAFDRFFAGATGKSSNLAWGRDVGMQYSVVTTCDKVCGPAYLICAIEPLTALQLAQSIDAEWYQGVHLKGFCYVENKWSRQAVGQKLCNGSMQRHSLRKLAVKKEQQLPEFLHCCFPSVGPQSQLTEICGTDGNFHALGKSRYGNGSKPMVPFWGRCTTHFSLF